MIDINDAIKTVWLALEAYREDCIPEGDEAYDDAWSDVCTAMAVIQEDLNIQEITL
jgi:hypothetical protein